MMETRKEFVLNIVVWKGTTKKATLEQKLEGEKGVSHGGEVLYQAEGAVGTEGS